MPSRSGYAIKNNLNKKSGWSGTKWELGRYQHEAKPSPSPPGAWLITGFAPENLSLKSTAPVSRAFFVWSSREDT
jgi:hypothetical protein